MVIFQSLATGKEQEWWGIYRSSREVVNGYTRKGILILILALLVGST